MGTYLSTPNQEKESTDFSNDKLSFGASSMQGWRLSQEDAHSCLPDFDEDTSFFGVYDGHGGKEVAQYAAKYLPSYLLNHSHYKTGNIELALEESFLGFDATLIEEDVQRELRRLADDIPNSDHNVDDEDNKDNYIAKIKKEAALLREEASMPIEKVLERYGGVAPFSKVKNPNISRLSNRAKFQSPIINKKNAKNCADGNKAVGVDGDGLINGNLDLDEDEQLDVLNHPVKLTALTNGTIDTNDNAKIIQADLSIQNNIQIDESAVSGSNADKLKKVISNNNNVNIDEIDLIDNKCNEIIDGHVTNNDENDFNINVEYDDDEDDDDEDEEGNQFWEPENSDEDDDSDDEDDEDEDEFEADAEGDEECGGSSSAGVYKAKQHDDPTDEDNEDDEDDFNSISISDSFEESPGADSGCTAVVAVLKAGRLYVANAGDSRCVVSRGGVAVDMSIDHKPEDAEERARIKKAGGKVTCEGRVNGGLNLSRAIGDHTYKRNKKLSLKEQMITSLPDVKTIDITPQDRFMVLACDGIWNVLSSQDVTDFVEKALNDGVNKLSSICEQLFDVCLSPDTKGDGTGCDNMTCVIIAFRHTLNSSTSGQSNLLKSTISIVAQSENNLPPLNHLSSNECEITEKNGAIELLEESGIERVESRKRKSTSDESADQVTSSAISFKKPCLHENEQGSSVDEGVTSSLSDIITSSSCSSAVSNGKNDTNKIVSSSGDIGSSVD